jgi:hypothetical protein
MPTFLSVPCKKSDCSGRADLSLWSFLPRRSYQRISAHCPACGTTQVLPWYLALVAVVGPLVLSIAVLRLIYPSAADIHGPLDVIFCFLILALAFPIAAKLAAMFCFGIAALDGR